MKLTTHEITVPMKSLHSHENTICRSHDINGKIIDISWHTPLVVIPDPLHYSDQIAKLYSQPEPHNNQIITRLHQTDHNHLCTTSCKM